MNRDRTTFAIVVAGVLAMLVVAGCGGGDDGDSGADGSSGGGISAEDVDLDALYQGTYEDPPSSAPDHKPGMKIFLLSCGQSIPFCASAMEGAEEAASSLGWDTTLVDSKGDPNLMSQGVRQAIAADADGIFIEAFDCEYMKQALVEAKEAGIPVVGSETRDCNEDLDYEPTQGPKLFTSVVSYAVGDLPDMMAALGDFQAQYMLAKTEGDLDAMSFWFTDVASSRALTVGYDETLASCETCQDTEVGFTIAEAGVGLQEKAEQALVKSPDINAIRVDSDGTLTGGVLAAANTAAPDALILAVEGQEAVLDLVRDGDTRIAGTGFPTAWEGWAGIDGLIRAMAGEPPEPSGLGAQIWDADHNLPESGPYVPPIDFRTKYRQAWGVE